MSNPKMIQISFSNKMQLKAIQSFFELIYKLLSDF